MITGRKGMYLQSFGYATYIITILSDSTQEAALEYAPPHCAQRIFINGELLVETGKVGTTPDEHVPSFLTGTVRCPLDSGMNELIIQVSNFSHYKGGVYKVPVIGQSAFLFSKRDSKLMLDSFVIGILFILGAFFLGLSVFWQNNRLFTYFGLFAPLFSLWYGNFGIQAFWVYFTSLSWDVAIHLTYLSFYGFLCFVGLFVYEVFKEYHSKYSLKFFLTVYILAFLTVVFCNPKFFTSLMGYVHMMVLCHLFYTGVLLIIRAFRSGAIMSILSFLALVLSSSAVIGMFYSVLPWVSELAGMLFLVTFLLFAILMVRKVGGSYKTVLQMQQETNAQKEMIQAQATKLRLLDEMKTRFFANVSHDFRSPLTLIKGNLNRIKRKNIQLHRVPDDGLEKIEVNVNQLIQFANEIRDLNLLDQKVLSISYSEIGVVQLLKEIYEMFHSLAEMRDIDFSFAATDEEILIRADENKLRKVFNNLLSNAFKFTEDHGRISLSIKAVEKGVMVKLSDSGVGITKEEQPFIFDRFYQSKQNTYRSKEGMGIGLAMVRELISLHEGTVTLKSEQGVGSEFSILLPYNHDKPLSEKPKAEDRPIVHAQTHENTDLAIDFHSKGKSSQYVILLVDDHHEVRKYIASLIHEQYYVIEAQNGVEAYDVLKKQKVDLVITDLMMPWMDGFELIDKVHADAELSRIKIMVVSARTTQEDKLKVLSKGVNEFMSKPFDEDEFNTRILNVLSGTEPSVLHDLAEKKGKYSDIEQNILLKLNNLVMEQIDNSKLTIAMLADELATSERNANRVIHKLTGLSPKAYIQKVRINYAELLLKEGRVKSLTEAGSAIGMQNTTQFAKQFEKVKGYHPSKVKLDSRTLSK